MDVRNSNVNDGLRTSISNSYIKMELYLLFHSEVTKLAFKYTGELEEAKDIASECLIEWWQQTYNDPTLHGGYPCSNSEVAQVCSAVKMYTKQRRLAEQGFVQEHITRVPAHTVFMLAEKETVLHLSQVLHPLEQTVIRLILKDEFDLPEVSTILKKPVTAIKIIRDRATVLLRKKLLKKPIFIIITDFIVGFSDTLMA